MQTTIQTVTNTLINPYASHEAEQASLVESLGSISSRFSQLSSSMKDWANELISQVENERQIVRAVDSKFSGEVMTTKDKDGIEHQWQGYSKLADIVVEEYQSRLKGIH